MLAAAALGALGAQLEQLQAAKQDWFVGASLVDEQDISLEADGAVTVRRQAFDKALRNFPKTDSPSKAKAARKMEVTDYDQVIAGGRFCSRSCRFRGRVFSRSPQRRTGWTGRRNARS